MANASNPIMGAVPNYTQSGNSDFYATNTTPQRQPSFDVLSRATQNYMVGNVDARMIPHQLKALNAALMREHGPGDRSALLTAKQQMMHNLRAQQPVAVTFTVANGRFNQWASQRFKAY